MKRQGHSGIYGLLSIFQKRGKNPGSQEFFPEIDILLCLSGNSGSCVLISRGSGVNISCSGVVVWSAWACLAKKRCWLLVFLVN